MTIIKKANICWTVIGLLLLISSGCEKKESDDPSQNTEAPIITDSSQKSETESSINDWWIYQPEVDESGCNYVLYNYLLPSSVMKRPGCKLLDDKGDIITIACGTDYMYYARSFKGCEKIQDLFGENRKKRRISYKRGKCVEGNCIEGYGKYIEEDGSIYEGKFEHQVKFGPGKMTYPNGEVIHGFWRKGDFATEIIRTDTSISTGRLKFPNGNIYEGEHKNGVPHGKGKLTTPKGSIFEGEWIKGKFMSN